MGGQTYENVYLMVVDASGYSTIVRHNARDHAARVSDMFREKVLERVNSVASQWGCSVPQLWTWRGDGGILAIYDDNESVARDVALTAAHDILRLDLEQVRTELRRMSLTGELGLRLAVHKSTIRFTPDGHTGTIHSPDLNFVVHLEEITPPNCVAISSDVYESAGLHTDSFTAVGTFEDRRIYIMALSGGPADARRAWLRTAGPTGSCSVFVSAPGLVQDDRASTIDTAEQDVVDLGTTLDNTTYLLTSTHSTTFQDAMLEFLGRGGTYRGVLLEPSCEATAILSEYLQEDLPTKIRTSLASLTAFKERHASLTRNFHVHQSLAYPGFTALAADLDSASPLVLYSPEFMAIKLPGTQIDQSAPPHYLATSGPILTQIRAKIAAITCSGTLRRVV